MADIVHTPAPGGPPAAEPGDPGTHQVTRYSAQGPKQSITVEPADPAAGGEPAPAADPSRPSWLPAKFKSAEDMAKAYAELERRQSQPRPAEGFRVSPGAPDPVAEGEPVIPGATPEGEPRASGLVQAMTDEYAQTGAISPEMRQRFVKETGLAESYIDSHLRTLKDQETGVAHLAEEMLGGPQAATELLRWAGQRLSDDDQRAFNSAVYSGDERMARFAIQALESQYQAEIGRAPRVIAGRRPSEAHGGLKPFQSQAEMIAAQRSPRYRVDEGFRAEVAERAAMAHEMGLL